MMTVVIRLRSFLYVPGDRADRVAKAFNTNANAVLIDLEDSVAVSAKEAARRIAVESLRARSEEGPALWVRINTGEWGRADATALAAEAKHLGGVVLAKCEDLSWLDEIGSKIPFPVPLSPLIESALAVRRLDELCGHPRVTQCHLGEIDLLADLGVKAEAASAVLGHAQAEVLLASAGAGLLPPIGGVYGAFRDLDGLSSDCVRLAQIGFAGRPAIHPSQVDVINAAFRPSVEERAAATRLVESYERAISVGQGVLVDEDGMMLDEAVVRRARRLLADLEDEELFPK